MPDDTVQFSYQNFFDQYFEPNYVSAANPGSTQVEKLEPHELTSFEQYAMYLVYKHYYSPFFKKSDPIDPISGPDL